MKPKYRKFTNVYMSYLEKIHKHSIGFWNTTLRNKLYLGFWKSYEQGYKVEE